MASLPPPPGPIWTPLPPPPPFPARRPRGAAVVAAVVAVLLAISGVVVFSNSDPPRGSFRFLDRTAAGLPVRWNPCEPIHYVANLEDAPVGALEDLQGAARRLSEATGIEFVYDGETEVTVEFQTYARYIVSTMQGGRWLPVLVIWLPHDEFTLWDSQEGVVAFAHPESGPADLEDQYVSGLIVVDAEAGLPSGFDYRFSDGLVLMHELGHLVGLGHVTDPNELMFTSQRLPGNPISDWGPGDREGLRELGREAGCLTMVRTSSPSTSP